MPTDFPLLLSPLAVRGAALRNRTVSTTRGTYLSCTDEMDAPEAGDEADTGEFSSRARSVVAPSMVRCRR
jgi:hypothetical protein